MLPQYYVVTAQTQINRAHTNFNVGGIAIQNSLSSPQATATCTIQELVAFKSSNTSRLYIT